MYGAVHGPLICGSRTFPTTCSRCRQAVFYFHCTHGSKVFFDELGHPWPVHNCGAGTTQLSPTPPRPSGRTAWSTLEGVTFSVQSRDHGLLPGMTHASVDMPEAAIRRVRDAGSRPRETMRIDPLGASKESLIGRVTDVHRVDLLLRLGLDSGSIGAQMIANRFLGLEAVQITLLVDELDLDPDAVDMFSYTLWVQSSSVADSVARNDLIEVGIEAVELLGEERRWVATSLEIL